MTWIPVFSSASRRGGINRVQPSLQKRTHCIDRRHPTSERRTLCYHCAMYQKLALLGDARADPSYAARLFARQPAILLLTILGLSLGLGVATAAFSITNAAVLRGEGGCRSRPCAR